MSGAEAGEPVSAASFDAAGRPHSRLYDDLYFSAEDGLAESRAVFLGGCGLPDAWVGRRRYWVAELGFGTGLNVAALVELWSRSRPPDGHLHIFSVEAHPLTAAEAARALAAWPELLPVTDVLIARWPGRRPGFHRVDLAEFGVTLDVAIMEGADALAAWEGHADAWFLDGFAPARNPAMWRDEVLRLAAERSAPGARAASYTVAGSVRRGLEAAGFTVARQPGFGRKRQRLEAYARGAAVPDASPSVAIVGAGIAGASLARAFRRLGVEPRVLEAQAPGAGASGAPAALVTPRLDAGDGAIAAFYAQALDRAGRLYAPIPEAVISRGVLQLESAPRDARRFAAIAASGVFEPGALGLLSADEAAALLGEPAAGALAMHTALVIEPAAVLGAWLGSAERRGVTRVERAGTSWRLRGEGDRDLGLADIVCLANGAGLADLWPEAPIQPVRGQLTWALTHRAPRAAAWGGYVIPMRGGALFGATHDRDDADREPRSGDDAHNLRTLAARLPALAASLAGDALNGRAAVRATTPDRLPLAGSIGDGLFVLGGMGSRGFTAAPLLAEHVAAVALGAPSPLPLPLSRIVQPLRFEERFAARQGLRTAPGSL